MMLKLQYSRISANASRLPLLGVFKLKLSCYSTQAVRDVTRIHEQERLLQTLALRYNFGPPAALSKPRTSSFSVVLPLGLGLYWLLFRFPFKSRAIVLRNDKVWVAFLAESTSTMRLLAFPKRASWTNSRKNGGIRSLTANAVKKG